MLGLKIQRTLPRRSAIIDVESTASESVVIRVGRELPKREGVEQTEHVVLDRSETHDLVHLLESALEGGLREEAGAETRSHFDALTAGEQDRLALAAVPLWDALDELGWTDSHGGAEFQRVFPETVEFIHRQSNQMPPFVLAAAIEPKEKT